MNKSSREVLTFEGGIHPSGDGKALSSGSPIAVAPLLAKYQVVISENAGKPPKPVVKAGDLVKKYQLIAAADGFVSANLHAPTSGKVTGIVEVPGSMGVPVPAIEIEADGQDEAGEMLPPIDWRNAAPADLVARIAAAGLVGMGGAAFPTHVKLSPPPEKKIDTLIFNGAECEPYLTADHRLMLEAPEQVLEGAAISGHILGVSNIYIGIEETKTNGHAVVDASLGYIGVPSSPIALTFHDGRLSEIEQSAAGEVLRCYMDSFDDPGIYVAGEFGIGLNRRSRCLGNCYIEDESTFSTFHIGMGRNLALGGIHDAAGHFDLVFREPTIYADSTLIMKNGLPAV